MNKCFFWVLLNNFFVIPLKVCHPENCTRGKNMEAKNSKKNNEEIGYHYVGPLVLNICTVAMAAIISTRPEAETDKTVFLVIAGCALVNVGINLMALVTFVRRVNEAAAGIVIAMYVTLLYLEPSMEIWHEPSVRTLHAILSMNFAYNVILHAWILLCLQFDNKPLWQIQLVCSCSNLSSHSGKQFEATTRRSAD